MNKKNQLVDLSFLENNENILQDIAYLRKNLLSLHDSGMRFKYFPENIKQNPFFVLDYFSKIESNPKEYKQIPVELLKEQFFVSACLEKNPDIYLLAEPVCHTEYAFKIIADSHPTKFLKYAKESDLNDVDFCKKALKISVSNFRYMPEKFRCTHEIIMFGLGENMYSRENYARASEVVKHIPSKILDDKLFVNRMLDRNKYVFAFLPSSYKKDELVAKKMSCEDTYLFAEVDDSLKQNKEFVEKLFDYKEKKEKNYDFRSLENFSEGKILKELDESFFTREFCQKHNYEIRRIYAEMNKKIRANLEVIRSVYHYDPIKNTNSQLYESNFLNKIQNQELIGYIKKVIKDTDKTNFYKSIQPKVFKLIDSYILQKELENTLVQNDVKAKRVKI